MIETEKNFDVGDKVVIKNTIYKELKNAIGTICDVGEEDWCLVSFVSGQQTLHMIFSKKYIEKI